MSASGATGNGIATLAGVAIAVVDACAHHCGVGAGGRSFDEPAIEAGIPVHGTTGAGLGIPCECLEIQ